VRVRILACISAASLMAGLGALALGLGGCATRPATSTGSGLATRLANPLSAQQPAPSKSALLSGPHGSYVGPLDNPRAPGIPLAEGLRQFGHSVLLPNKAIVGAVQKVLVVNDPTSGRPTTLLVKFQSGLDFSADVGQYDLQNDMAQAGDLATGSAPVLYMTSVNGRDYLVNRGGEQVVDQRTLPLSKVVIWNGSGLWYRLEATADSSATAQSLLTIAEAMK
jgi:hypothetical protein